MIDDGTGSAQQYRGNTYMCTGVRVRYIHVVVGYLDTVLMCAPVHL